jgi:hypothetical protein
MNSAGSASELDDIIAREKIRDCLARLAHAMDRGDIALAKTTYWPEAAEDHWGSYKGPVLPRLESTISFLRTLRPCWKIQGNSLIRISGSKARVESYFFSINVLPNERGLEREVMKAGRFLDEVHQRNGEWRIMMRTVVIDWFRESDPVDLTSPLFGVTVDLGLHSPNDPANELFRDSLHSN